MTLHQLQQRHYAIMQSWKPDDAPPQVAEDLARLVPGFECLIREQTAQGVRRSERGRTVLGYASLLMNLVRCGRKQHGPAAMFRFEEAENLLGTDFPEESARLHESFAALYSALSDKEPSYLQRAHERLTAALGSYLTVAPHLVPAIRHQLRLVEQVMRAAAA